MMGTIKGAEFEHRQALAGCSDRCDSEEEIRLSPVAWWTFEGFSMSSRRPRLRRLSHYCWSV
jgi:hypothetical protein